MTTTDELRAELTKRGVEWKAWDGTHPITVWHDETYLYEFIEYRLVNGAKQVNGCLSDNDGHCELTIKVFNCTPEQAIAVTLGRGTCVPILNSERDRRPYLSLWFVCSECGCRLTENRLGKVWQKFCPQCGRRVKKVYGC